MPLVFDRILKNGYDVSACAKSECDQSCEKGNSKYRFYTLRNDIAFDGETTHVFLKSRNVALGDNGSVDGH